MAFEELVAASFSKDQVVIAVSRSNMGAGHVGIGFHSAKEGPKVLHLAWHKRLERETIPGELKTCWAATALIIPAAASKQLVAFIRVVAARGAAMSYGINLIAARGSFSSNGSYKPTKNSDGLTCATYVLEVLRAGRVDLIKVDTWQANAANEVWGRAVCDELVKCGADEDHVDAVRKNVSGLRLRPFEVAGAVELGSAEWPADFDSVQPMAKKVEDQLSLVCPIASELVINSISIPLGKG